MRRCTDRFDARLLACSMRFYMRLHTHLHTGLHMRLHTRLHMRRCTGRLDARLLSAGLVPSPRQRLLASLKLCAPIEVDSLPASLGITPLEQAWLAKLEVSMLWCT